MYTVKINFEFNESVTEEQFQEWFKDKVLNWGNCSEDNPLINKKMSNVVTSFHVD